MSHQKPFIKLKKHWSSSFIPEDVRNFDEIINRFPKMLRTITKKSNIIDIYPVFGKSGIGKKNSIKLLKSKFPKVFNEEDFQGIYLFWHENEPFYTGISRGVVKRIHQHIKGKNHFSSSLSYLMGKQYHHELLGIKHKGTRREMDFDKYSSPFKKLLKEECQVSMLKIKSPVELYLFEVYLAVELKLSLYNQFKTH
ncbi:hypothetical protein B4Q04_10950 [Zobellia sp. OII3]|uniref:GIY-YIG nuclease family protein n=1 Tax=Zobellia sp. OII3 TaxID=2034520 RepID=UPI000B533BB7|nr:GIY-YIG nuclease family protein [Zobellia sp. OII3]OWW25058.1 hypothetical protein B4Q04_10950 [Zobellia sp. OII3]